MGLSEDGDMGREDGEKFLGDIIVRYAVVWGKERGEKRNGLADGGEERL